MGERGKHDKRRGAKVCVSIVIVCMNNLPDLCSCLDSIRRYTTVSYEVLVVAYLFTEENLAEARRKYPWATLIESNETRGFSENNNLALRQAKGEYCLVLNDDTELTMPAVDSLVNAIRNLPKQVAVVSPKIVYPDGRVQACGVPPMNGRTYVLNLFHLWNGKHGRFTNGTGIFRTYNILGTAFLIKTDVFRKYGWFDETYFFCPEDIALSTLLNKEGYECYVDSDTIVVHKGGMSGKSMSFVQVATRPAQCRGEIMFYSGNSCGKRIVLSFVTFAIYSLRCLYHAVKGRLRRRPNCDYVLSKGDLNCIRECFSSRTPKEIFMKYYRALN